MTIKPYEEQAKAAKAEYATKFAAYKETEAYKAFQVKLAEVCILFFFCVYVICALLCVCVCWTWCVTCCFAVRAFQSTIDATAMDGTDFCCFWLFVNHGSSCTCA